ncbi:sugar transferase, PEP-CTERM/EpsH1 system associated [Variovorax sp. SRS16]|uniref:glycosyltransferase family 4 protein n=1 Tax=Variovorax sp. SRS16 TaxID=282217 RepID=UPI001315F786|nr:glycosyltransferase family 4 protein [Variovorax sp. SRS16]VTU13761.1 sugar transferase, PEP-CTERM/EpsH1 system associated [Variovorax sp. SRS16]
MPHSPVVRYVLKAAKGAWWLATPWRLRERLAFRQGQAIAAARTAELQLLVRHEEARVATRGRGEGVAPDRVLDLFSDEDASDAAGLPLGALLWAPLSPGDIRDPESAARFLIDLLRGRGDFQARCPGAPIGGSPEALGLWLRRDGSTELGEDAARHLADALDAGPGKRARQAYLAHERIGSVLPHGLTPAGMRRLFRWFMRTGRDECQLRLEEVWWLFLDAAHAPEHELMLAYAFSPAWQHAHPDGMTVFGRDAFAQWFRAEYGAEGAWLDPLRWPDLQPPAQQIRSSYAIRADWQAAHPEAFDGDPGRARALVAWLSSPEAGLPASVRDGCRRWDAAAVAAELGRPGVNVIGHFCYPSGLRVSVESMVGAMQAAGVPTSLRDVLTDSRDEPRHVEYRGLECHDVTILHTQPEPFLDLAYARAHLSERVPRSYRIAYWYWEFDAIPDAWIAHAKDVDEVWAATEFVARGLRARLPLPVRTLFPGVRLAPFGRRGKAHFGLPENTFTFLFTFHMVSVMERKNPLGLIRAFKAAFTEEEPVRLVLKTSFSDRYPAEFNALRSAAAAAGAAITLIDEVYTPDEVLSLMDACDAYVSLHRSEGLGLTLAEAMLMGKPVIATAFSGNMDFMDDGNSLLVPYELVKLDEPIPPYDAGLQWAEPSLDHAAQLMHRLYENQAWARELGARGKASAEANLSLPAAGRRIAARLEEIRALRRVPR